MRRLLFAVSLAALLAFGAAPSAIAAEWRVPGDFATIQEAVDSPAVAAGDLIIVLYADFRWGAPGAVALAYKRVTKNKVAIVSDSPLVVDNNAFEMSDTSEGVLDPPVIFENAIGFNDFRGTASQIQISPAGLASVNAISRNLGANRGKGLHPSVFR